MDYSLTYQQKLKDPRWQKLKSEIQTAARFTCEDCGCKTRTFHVHHTAYATGKMPWEYGPEHLMCICDACHDKRQKLEDAFRMALGEITRLLPIDRLEEEVWKILQDVRFRETQRLAEAMQ